MAKHMFKNVNWKEVGLLVVLLCVLGYFWETPAVYPLKILVVFFHELSHAIAAWVTGGDVIGIELSRAEGGLCTTAGGNRFIVISAGYLGSLLWGALLLLLSVRTRYDKPVMAVLGLLLLAVTLFLVRPFSGFGFIFGVLFGALLAATGFFLPQAVNAVLLRVVGLTSCAYAVLDIKSDILDRPTAQSDAYALAEYTGLPTLFWGLLWMAIALIVTLRLLIATSQKTKDQPRKLELPRAH